MLALSYIVNGLNICQQQICFGVQMSAGHDFHVALHALANLADRSPPRWACQGSIKSVAGDAPGSDNLVSESPSKFSPAQTTSLGRQLV